MTIYHRYLLHLLLSQLLNLLLVDVFHQDTLVLEDITLCLHVEVMVQVSVDLLVLAVLFQQTTQHTHTSDPQNLNRHTSVGGTLPLTGAGVTALTTGFHVSADTGSRVHGDGLADDETILDQLAHMLARVGVGDLVVFVGVKPDLVLTALEDGRSETLLKSQRTKWKKRVVSRIG